MKQKIIGVRGEKAQFQVSEMRNRRGNLTQGKLRIQRLYQKKRPNSDSVLVLIKYAGGVCGRKAYQWFFPLSVLLASLVYSTSLQHFVLHGLPALYFIFTVLRPSFFPYDFL